MKKYIFLATVFLIMVVSTSAQYTVDTEAKTILDKTAQAIQKSTGSKAEFSLVISNTQTGQKQSMNGTLFLKGEKFKLLVADMETYYDEKSQWLFMPDIKEVTVSTPTADELKEVNPTAILSSYKQDYKLKKEDDKTIDGKPAFIVNIYPEDRTKSYHRIEVIVEKSTYNIMSVSTYGKNGTDTAVKIKKYEKGQNFPDQIFVFDPKKYPEIEVIDLR